MKKNEIPHPRLGPRKYEKKKTKKYKSDPKTAIFGAVFVFFSVSFSYFRGPTWGGGFRIFFVFSGLGFLGSVAGLQGHKSTGLFSALVFRLLEGKQPLSESHGESLLKAAEKTIDAMAPLCHAPSTSLRHSCNIS